MARRVVQAVSVLVLLAALLAVAAYWAGEHMKVDSIGPPCAAMASC